MTYPEIVRGNDLRQSLLRSLASEGVPMLALVEPEVIECTLSQVRRNALASTIANLIANHEPLLMASADGSTVTVRDIGSGAVLRVEVAYNVQPGMGEG